MKYAELPEPWEEIEAHLPTAEQDQLEALVGSKLTYKDLTDDDVVKDGELTTPKSIRASYVMGYRWVRLRNSETHDEVILRLQFKGPGSQEIYVSAVIAPFSHGGEITGSQLRSIPLSSIAAAYSAQQIGGTINLNQVLALGDAVKGDHTKPLEQGRITDPAFLANVGIQFETLSEKYPDADIVDKMAKLNDVGSSTVKKWLAAARKRLFLMPVASGRRRG